MKKVGYMQIGKQGLVAGSIEMLNNLFVTHENVRISVLKSAGHDKNTIKEINLKILEKLGKRYTSRIIGFTIVLKKQRRIKEEDL